MYKMTRTNRTCSSAARLTTTSKYDPNLDAKHIHQIADFHSKRALPRLMAKTIFANLTTSFAPAQ
jgi:hypothetical protein